MNQVIGNEYEHSIIKNIRQSIKHNTLGNGGQYVVGQDKNTVLHRIIDARFYAGSVQGRSLATGKWFTLSGWDTR